MTPDDFKLAGHWCQATRGNRDGRRPIYKLTHPQDPAFYAQVTLNPPVWAWSIHGRVGGTSGYNTRKRHAMWDAINALTEYHRRATTHAPRTPRAAIPSNPPASAAASAPDDTPTPTP